MVKKINKDGIAIKELHKMGYKPSQIAKIKKISKQKVNYWLKTEIKTEIRRRTKLNEEEIQRVVELAENKTTSEMGSMRLTEIINEELKNEGKQKKVGKSTICVYLKNRNVKLRKIQKVFALDDNQKKKIGILQKDFKKKNPRKRHIFY